MKPKKYSELSPDRRRELRQKYAEFQDGKCWHCKSSLSEEPPKRITNKKIDWSLFPPNFLKYPVHLQHDHGTDLTEGAVHSYCNAVLWQYEHR